ncbi:MAG: Fic family protein [Acidimicrobiaceae bacterium]|nr:Fic family protein [Acidimicrobiaceae bacterium]
MGRLVDRFWDEHRLVSRPADETDPLSGIFHAYVPYPIIGFKLLLNADTWHRVHAAEQAVAALPSATAAPTEWLLTRAESAASSTIEGIRPSARRLARAEAQLALGKQRPRYGDLEALGNISATRLAVKTGAENRAVTIDDICAIHASLSGDDPQAGEIRSRQSWIGSGISSTPLNAAFVPPPPETLPTLLEDLVAAINEPAASPLAHAAVVHAQFETIHPFVDGNGRTGRALIQLMLRRSGLTTACPPPISSALALNRDAYISALNSSHPVCAPDDPKRSAALTQWIMLCADACVQACDYTSRIISHVTDLQQAWHDQLLSSGVRSSNSVMRLIEVLPANPILNATTVAGLLAVNTRTAQRAIDLLADAGILVQRSAGKRNRIYEAEAVMDAFATLTRVDRNGGSLNLPSSTKHTISS